MRTVLVCNAFSGEAQKRISALTWLAADTGLRPEELILFAPSAESARELRQPCGRVRVLTAAHFETEPYLSALARLAEERDDGPALWLFDSSFAGQELAVRLGARMGGCSLCGVQALRLENGQLFAQKMVYSNHMLGEFRLERLFCCLSLAAGVSGPPPAEAACPTLLEQPVRCPGEGQLTPLEKTDDLADARLLIAVGRGAGSKAAVREMEAQAASIGAQLGVSRQAAMNAWAPMDRLLGISGVLAHPEVCIAAGVSGAAAFLAGVEKSRHLVAVNTDPNAPICGQADVVVEGDCVAFVSLLTDLISQEDEHGTTPTL
ncbi:MAG: FAD-binding protein [Clostridiales bacterium]|nr:FAD-binding protein [Clostridiales bacterium]